VGVVDKDSILASWSWLKSNLYKVMYGIKSTICVRRRLEREWVRDFVERNWYFRINTEETEDILRKKSTKGMF